jgi:hypothetical protein
MKTIQIRLPLVAAIFGAVTLICWQAIAEGNRVAFPNLEQLVHYTTVRRGNVTEHMLTTQDAIAAVKAGQPIPNGSHVVLVDYREGEVFRYFVMQKGNGWGRDYDDRRRTADWQFQWFKPDRTINMNENTTRCQSCHQARADNEYLYTFDQMKAFD